MPPRATWAFLLVLTLSGCLSGSSSQPDGPGRAATRDVQAGDPADVRTVVHDSKGQWLPDSAFPEGLPEFEEHYVGTSDQLAGEPTIGVVPSGAAFYVALNPGFKPDVWRSRDLGASWDKVTPTYTAGLVDYPPSSNDPFVYADPLTGRLFDVDYGLSADCLYVQWSDDEGASWDRSEAGQCFLSRTSYDHQSLAAGVPHNNHPQGYANVVYYCVNRSQAQCYRSLDGAATWDGPVATGLDHCGGLTGHVVTAPNGDAFLPQVSCHDGPDAKDEDEVWLAVSRDDGLSWEPILVSNRTVPVAKQYTNSHEGSIAVDSAGTVYYMFMDERTLPRLAVSHDGGRTWGAPMDISRPGLTGATLPSLIAGDKGRIAWLYVGTTSPGGHEHANAATTWNAYIGMSVDADQKDPVFVTTSANALEDPVKRGSCADRCQGFGMGLIPGGMYDFLDVSIDPVTGRVWTALVDVCNQGCGQPEGNDDGTQMGRAAVGVQVGGAMLRATHSG